MGNNLIINCKMMSKLHIKFICVIGVHKNSSITLVNVKSGEFTYNALVSAFFRTGAGENAIPTVIIMFVWA